MIQKSQGDYNHDVMRITWDLLCANPDVYSIWNMRKEFVLNKKAEYERQLEELRALTKSEEAAPGEVQPEKEVEERIPKNKDSPGDKEDEPAQRTEEELAAEFQKVCNEELELTEFALLKNSKSYSAWNHRLWILSLIPKPDFEREFRLNELYLQKDGRNRVYSLPSAA